MTTKQMAKSTAGITGVSGERPSGGGTPKPKAGYDIGNQKASRLTTIGSQSLEATRQSVGKHTSAPMGDQGTKVDKFWKGHPHSEMHVKAPGLPPINSNVP